MKVVFVAGAWGSGTTALAGALAKLGVTAFGPHLQTNDAHTQGSYELVAFRDLVLSYVDEQTLQLRGDCETELRRALEQFALDLQDEKFGTWPRRGPRRAVLKLPAATLCLPQLAQVFSDISFVVMHRPFHEIEASRLRRRWSPNYGARGASVLYSKGIFDLMRLNLSYLAVSYRDLTRHPNQTLIRVMQYCDLDDLQPNLPHACAFVRPVSPPPAR